MTTPRVTVRAVAPGGIGNMGPGLDILGCAISGPADSVSATRIDAPGVRLDDPGHPELPRDPERHTSAIAARDVLRRANATDVGIALTVTKGLPLCGGQGGSSESGVAGAVAANALLGNPLGWEDVLAAALHAEEQVAGRHLDNLAPCLLGGILLVRSMEPFDVVRLPVPARLRIAVVHPEQQLRTADARTVLPASVDRATALAQASAVAGMVAAFCTGDLSLLRSAVDDRIAEPVRAPLLPGFVEAKAAALEAGALGCSISGSGPTSFAFAASDADAERIATAMCRAYAQAGVRATARVARVDERGARVVNVDGQPVGLIS